MAEQVDMQILTHCAGIPDYATKGAAAMDLSASIEDIVQVWPGQSVLIPTGVAIKMPETMAAVLLPRSGLGSKNGIVLGNLTGLIDSDYHREIFVSVWNRNFEGEPYTIGRGDRIAQMLFVPVVRPHISMVQTLEDNGRGGFGHTGV